MTSHLITAEPAVAGPIVTELRDAAGRGYAGEWALFCDYTTATDQPALPTTLDALVGFLGDVPAAASTMSRRVRAIATAHRRAGLVLERPTGGPGAAPSPRRNVRPDHPGALLAACPTRGWPDGFWGRRDAFLVVLVEVLGLSAGDARRVRPTDIDTTTLGGEGEPGEATPPERLAVRGHAVPGDPDPRSCPACAVARWLEVLGVADGIGRGSARMDLHLATAPGPTSLHRHAPPEPTRWRRAATVLLPAIDRHGTHDHQGPMSTRAIRGRLALARGRSDAHVELAGRDPDATVEPTGLAYRPPPTRPLAGGPARAAPTRELVEVLTTLDDLADHADALNERVLALLDQHAAR